MGAGDFAPFGTQVSYGLDGLFIAGELNVFHHFFQRGNSSPGTPPGKPRSSLALSVLGLTGPQKPVASRVGCLMADTPKLSCLVARAAFVVLVA
mmetsp:Transcript_2555/g.6125  ORF Transcript_2555/g.6125 Transcript_2555/m.6125 type:complete len:94 (-) Transcript_2555:331-612(-)